MNNERIISEIKRIYEKYILKDINTFCVNDYNKFEEEIWTLKEKYQLKSSPFLLLSDPAKDADLEMMNATNDGLTEPSLDAKRKYLAMMRVSYDNFMRIHKEN